MSASTFPRRLGVLAVLLVPVAGLACSGVVNDDVSLAADPVEVGPSAAAAALETVPANEEEASRHIAEVIAANVKREFTASDESQPVARRDAHAKHHGCVRAQVAVSSDIPQDLRVGVFQPGKSYDAWVRLSNGNGKVRADREGDGRGMAIKLLGVPGDKILGGADRAATTQDFLMINHPTFFVRNASDYVKFTDVVARDGDPKKFFFPGLNPFEWHAQEALIGNAIRSHKIASPLEAQYFSMTSYLLGNRAVKISARPCGGFSEPKTVPDAPDYLRERMAETLSQQSACFELMVQVQKDKRSMPVEDPTEEWREWQSPFRKAATITIPKQTFDTKAQQDYCENLSFTPWHSLPEHRPLGGINRVRRTVYETISRVRHELNGVVKTEPTDLSVPGQ